MLHLLVAIYDRIFFKISFNARNKVIIIIIK